MIRKKFQLIRLVKLTGSKLEFPILNLQIDSLPLAKVLLFSKLNIQVLLCDTNIRYHHCPIYIQFKLCHNLIDIPLDLPHFFSIKTRFFLWPRDISYAITYSSVDMLLDNPN